MSRLPSHPAGSIDQGPGTPPPPADQAPRSFGFPSGAGFQTLLVVAVEADYLRCKRFDELGDPVGEQILVAKPPELRHDALYYEGVSGVTTEDAQSIDVQFEGGGSDEQWTVKPPYLAHSSDEGAKLGTQIVAAASPMARGVEVEIDEVPTPLTLQDINVAGRVWGLSGGAGS